MTPSDFRAPVESDSVRPANDRAGRQEAVPAIEEPGALELRERFAFASEAAQIGFWFCDLPFDKLVWDARVKEHFWLPPDAEVDIGLFFERLHPDDRERTREAMDVATRSRTRYDIEYRTVSPEGGEKWIRAIGRVAYDAAGHPVRFDGITQDITQLKRTEIDLRESQRQFMIFADSLPALAWMADAEGWLFWYNRRWYEYTGATPEQLAGWGWQSVHDPEMLPSVMEKWTRSIRTGEPFTMVFPLRGADGVFRSFLTRIVPIRDEQGRIVRWFGTNTEVDELQRTRDALQMSEERTRVALKNVPLYLYTTDRELRYTWIYRAHPEFPPERILGRRDIDLDRDMYRELHAFKQSVLDSGMPASREFRFPLKDRVGVFEIGAEPLRDPEGNVAGLTVAALDVTQIRLSEETLRKTEKLAVVGRLAASIAHEINNPLESVVNLLYLMQDSAEKEEVRTHIRLAQEELARVSEIVTHALRFHRQPTAPAPAQVETLVESALGLYGGRLRQSNVRVERRYRQAADVLCFDSELRQVFANLLGNALDAAPGGAIAVRVRSARQPRTRQAGVRVTIADSGHGMPPQTLARLFEPFFTTKGSIGTGLGLWISAEILARHEALLKVRSSTRPPHRGTTFSVFFPLSPRLQRRTQDTAR